MVLTITVVGNGQGNGNPGGHAVLSPNELAQLMSGHTMTGLLNPDGSITLNPGMVTAQQLATMPTTIQNSINTMTSSSGPTSYQQSRIQMDTLAGNSITGLQSMPNHPNTNVGSNAASSNTQSSTTSKKTGQKRLTAKQKAAQQQQQQQQQQQEQQQPQQQQFQNQQIQQLPDTRQMMSGQPDHANMNQQPQVVATVQLPNGQIGQLIAPSGGQIWSPSAINLQQLSMAVAAATGSMPQSMSIPSSNSSGQSGQQDGNPNIQQQQPSQQQTQHQQQSMQMQQNGQQQQQQQQSLNNSSNQVMSSVQLPNNQIGQVMGRPGQNQIWSGGPISLTQLTALAQQGVVQLSPIQGVPTSGPNGQIVSQVAIQGLLGPNGQPLQTMPITSGGQYVTQDPNDPGKWQIVSSPQSNSANMQTMTTANINPGRTDNELSVAPSCDGDSTIGNYGAKFASSTQSPIINDGAQSAPPQRKLKRLACTCPNCRDGDNSRSGADKKKQHVCHFPDCNKVYGKTSHLRAHLRWHSGERPYVCSWSFCGKKFTRSDELQRHRRTHTGEKRFQCSECLKRFMRSDHLSKHLKTHSSSKKGAVGQQPQEGSDTPNIANLPSSQVKVEAL